MKKTTTNQNNLKLIGLARVSGAKQADADRLGLPRQLASLEAIAAKHNATLEVVQIAHVSGSDVATSPAWLTQVLPKLQEGWHLALDAVDRLCRADTYDLTTIMQLCRYGVHVYTPWEVVDMAGPGGARIAEDAIRAGREKREITRRFYTAKQAGREAGRWVSGRFPRGLKCETINRQGVWSETEEADTVRAVFSLYAEGQSLTSIARQVGWTRPVCTFILRNPIYSGWLVCDTEAAGERYQTASGKWRKRLVKRAPEDVIKVQVMGGANQAPAVVSDALWRTVQARLKATSKRHTSRASETSKKGWWSGVLHPADAPDVGIPSSTGFAEVGLDTDSQTQHVLYVFNDNKGNARYRCRCGQRGYEHSRIGKCNIGNPHADRINKALDRFFHTLTTGTHFLTVARAALTTDSTNKRPDLLANLQAGITKQERKKDRLLDLYADGDLSKAVYKQKVADCDKAIADLQAEVDRLNAAPLLPTADDLEALAESWAYSPLWSQEQKRVWVNRYVDAVNISRTGVESVSLRVPAEDGTVTFTYAGSATFDDLAPLPKAPTSTNDVANLLGLTRIQLNSFCKRGIIPRPANKKGKAYIWTQAEVAAAVAAYRAHRGLKEAA